MPDRQRANYKRVGHSGDVTCRVGLLLIVIAALSGCGDDADDPAPARPEQKIMRGRLGDTIELRTRRGYPLLVTARSVRDPVREHAFERARISGRFVGVEISLQNRGEIAFRGSPWSGSRLVTSEGTEIPTFRLKTGSCLGISRVVISPGSRRTLCIPFEVVGGAELLRFRYSPHAGSGPAAGVWKFG